MFTLLSHRAKSAGFLVLAAVGVLLIYYFRAMDWRITEIIKFTIGIILLWVPAAALFYYALQPEIADRMARFTFSAIGSYVLVTVAYTALTELHLEAVFYLAQVVILIIGVLWSIRRKSWRSVKGLVSTAWGVHSTLLFVIAVSLITTIDFQKIYDTNPDTGAVTLRLSPDVFFAAGQSYQLAQGIPLTQSSIRAGTPERAYHFLGHVTTMLIASYTQQPDMMRALTAYHYTIITILISLALYTLVKTITGSRWAGYCAIALMYIVVFNWPALVPSGFLYFYFTLFPNGINGLTVATAEPQMYSGIVVMYGGLLGFLLLADCYRRKQKCSVLPLITGVIIASSLRFRLHFGIVMLPSFLLLILLMGLQRRQRAYFVAFGVSFVVGLLMYLETKLPIYLNETASISLGYNGLTAPGAWETVFYNSWPTAPSIYQWLSQIIPNPDILKWVWQAVDFSAFTIFNIVGIPLSLATLLCLFNKSFRNRFAQFYIYVLLAAVLSIWVAISVNMTSDPYSLAGQIVYHVRWYLFPFMAVALWLLYNLVEKRYGPLSRQALKVSSYGVVFIFLVGHRLLPIVPASIVNGTEFVLDKDEQATLTFLHHDTPTDAVLLFKHNIGDYSFPFSGIAGRAVYLEAANNLSESYVESITNDNRVARLNALWAAPDSPTFCQLLLETTATYLIDYKSDPIAVHDPRCLQQTWISPRQEIVIWKVIR